MKKCVIFFILLLATLLLAVWTERRQGDVSAKEVALGDQGQTLRGVPHDPLSE